MSAPLNRTWFRQDPITCARGLIGTTLVWKSCKGIVVETEAYTALGDEAAHTWNRPSARAFITEHPPGAAYVYFNYGVHWMLNVLVKEGSADGFVLIRALEPIAGIPEMTARRSAKRRTPLKITELCSGPGKLAQALGVTGADHGGDFCTDERIAFFPPAQEPRVLVGPRIGISRSVDFPWRFVLANNPHISVPLP